MARTDISDSLIHYTRAHAEGEDPFDRLRSIVSDCCLLGGTGKIRGAHACVCFSEAPLASGGLVNSGSYSKYSPFGVMFKKEWIFEQGGRPVIYQPGAEYDVLPDVLKWRHVTYEPPTTDFTWEREWRVNCAELQFDPSVATIVLPTREYLSWLVADHEGEQDCFAYQYSTILAEDELRMYRDDFPWSIVCLDE